jgi:hypothetical protein
VLRKLWRNRWWIGWFLRWAVWRKLREFLDAGFMDGFASQMAEAREWCDCPSDARLFDGYHNRCSNCGRITE